MKILVLYEDTKIADRWLPKGTKIKVYESEKMESFVSGFYVANSVQSIYFSHAEPEIALETEITIVNPDEFEEAIQNITYDEEVGTWLGEYDIEIFERISDMYGIYRYY